MTTPTRKSIADYDAMLTHVQTVGGPMALWQVADLERHVDRGALLGGEHPPEPPYWAHLWSGARVLAAQVPRAAGRVLEIGCGLGLPGLAAARLGASVVFIDRERAPLAFVGESARSNGLTDVRAIVGDFTAPPFRAAFDWVLAAEILYDRARFALVARALAGLLRGTGRLLLTDGQRIDTRDFYGALDATGLAWRVQLVRVADEGFPVDVRVVEAWRP